MKRILVVGLVALCATLSADVEPEWDVLRDSRLGKLVAAYNAEKGSRQWTQTRYELTRLFESGRSELEALANQWIAAVPGLTAEEQVAFWQIARRVAPGSSGADDANRAIRRAQLKASPKQVRTRLYREAMASGAAPLGDGMTLSRQEACGLAALEGIEELTAEVEKNAGSSAVVPHVKETLVTLLRFRRGAEDQEDAVRLHLQRLAAMPADEIRRLGTSDRGFAGATAALKRDVDERRSSEMRDALVGALEPAFIECEGEESGARNGISQRYEGCPALEGLGLGPRARELRRERERKAGPAPH